MCVSASDLPSVEVTGQKLVMNALRRDGFSCTFDHSFNGECTPCQVGTYGDTAGGGCHSCPRGRLVNY